MMISEIQLKLKKGEMTCVDVVIQYLNNIKLHNEKLNVFITVTDNEALAYAKELDKLIDDNANNLDELFKKMPLLGVPVAYKDIYSTKNIRTTAASNMLKDYIAPYDATVVQKIKLAGGIMLGKLNCDAFAHGASGHNSDFGDTLNPYDVTCIPGGSSSGSGVSVATEMAVVGFGSDTGGSIRNPASWCNVVGIKPTYGRVSK